MKHLNNYIYYLNINLKPYFVLITKLSSKKYKINLKLKGIFEPNFDQICQNSLLLLTLSVIHYSNVEESDTETAQLNTTPDAAAETPDRDCRSATTAATPDRMTVRPPAPLPDNYLVSLHQCNLKTL